MCLAFTVGRERIFPKRVLVHRSISRGDPNELQLGLGRVLQVHRRGQRDLSRLVHRRLGLDHCHRRRGMDHRLAAGVHSGRHAHRAKPHRIGHRDLLRGTVSQRTAAGSAVHLVFPDTRPAAAEPAGLVQTRPQPDHLGLPERCGVPGPVHRRPCVRTSAYRHPGAATGPGIRRTRHGLQAAADLLERAAAPGLPDHHSAAYLGIPQRLQELLRGVPDRLDGTAGANQTDRRVLGQPVRGLHPGHADLFHPEHEPDAADARDREESRRARPDLRGGK